MLAQAVHERTLTSGRLRPDLVSHLASHPGVGHRDPQRQKRLVCLLHSWPSRIVFLMICQQGHIRRWQVISPFCVGRLGRLGAAGLESTMSGSIPEAKGKTGIRFRCHEGGPLKETLWRSNPVEPQVENARLFPAWIFATERLDRKSVCG
jgi:hypothetical protein